MNRPEPLQAAYDFARAPEPVSLLQGAAELVLGYERFAATADLMLRFLPNPHLAFRSRIQGAFETLFALVFNFDDDPLFLFNGQKIEGFRGRRESTNDGIELDWIPQFNRVALCDMHSSTTVAAIFHLFNFPDLRGGQHQASAAPAGCAMLVLESGAWRSSIQSLPNHATGQAWERIKAEGGCYLTHVAKLERLDGKPFSGNDAIDQLHLLGNFLSFVQGGRCWPVCEVGFDAAGQQTWASFSAPHSSNPAYSWFNPLQASQAERLFPLFVQRWQQSPEWQASLQTAIYWYLQANTGDAAPGIDAGIILAQSALERLAHQHLVVDRKMISQKRFKWLKASGQLRLLFASLNLPVAIGAATPDIHRLATGKWDDAPHAVTDIRNELVHPVSKKQVDACFVDAWKLSLWYLELSVLALCGYDGDYTSRLTASYVGNSGKVPWVQKGGPAHAPAALP